MSTNTRRRGSFTSVFHGNHCVYSYAKVVSYLILLCYKHLDIQIPLTGLKGYPTQYIIFLHLMFNQNKCWSNNIYGHKKWNFDVFFYLKVTVAMETAAILEIWRNYVFSFFWLMKRAIFKIPNQCYYLYIILWSDRRKLLFKSHKAQFGRIFDHKISILGKNKFLDPKSIIFLFFFSLLFFPNFLLSLHT